MERLVDLAPERESDRVRDVIKERVSEYVCVCVCVCVCVGGWVGGWVRECVCVREREGERGHQILERLVDLPRSGGYINSGTP